MCRYVAPPPEGVEHAEIDDALLRKYFDYFDQIGFIQPPTSSRTRRGAKTGARRKSGTPSKRKGDSTGSPSQSRAMPGASSSSSSSGRRRHPSVRHQAPATGGRVSGGAPGDGGHGGAPAAEEEEGVFVMDL